MSKFDDFDVETMKSLVKVKFGKEAKIYFSSHPDIHYVKILTQGKYFVADQNLSIVLSKGYDEIFFANQVPDSTFFSDEVKINNDIYSNQISYEHIESNKDLVVVKSNNKYGIFRTDGQEVLQIQYEKLIWISKDRIIFCMEGKYGVSNTKGIRLIPCIYDKIRPIPLIKQYGYSYEDRLRQCCCEDIKLIVASNKETDGYFETGFNMNGELIIRPCLSINLGEYFSIIETWNEFPYICAEVYRNLILELFPRRYYFLDLKCIGFDYTQYLEEYEDCVEYVCGKVVEN